MRVPASNPLPRADEPIAKEIPGKTTPWVGPAVGGFLWQLLFSNLIFFPNFILFFILQFKILFLKFIFIGHSLSSAHLEVRSRAGGRSGLPSIVREKVRSLK